MIVQQSNGKSTNYPGFGHYQPSKTKRLAIVVFDGEPTLYSIDDGVSITLARNSIIRMYMDDFDRGPEQIWIHGPAIG